MSEEKPVALMDILKQVKPEDVKEYLAVAGDELQKYESLIDKAVLILDKLERAGVIQGVMRMIMKKQGIDIIPAQKPDPMTIVAKSPSHLYLYRILNQESEESINALIQQIFVQSIKQQRKKKNVRKVEDQDNRNIRNEGDGQNIPDPSVHRGDA